MSESRIERLERQKEKLIRQWLRYRDIIEEYDDKCYKLTLVIKRINEEIEREKGGRKISPSDGTGTNGHTEQEIPERDETTG